MLPLKPLALALLLATSLPTRAQHADSVTVEAHAVRNQQGRVYAGVSIAAGLAD